MENPETHFKITTFGQLATGQEEIDSSWDRGGSGWAFRWISSWKGLLKVRMDCPGGGGITVPGVVQETTAQGT